MSVARHLFNIAGCIEKYSDIESARAWLLRGQRELSVTDFAELVDSVFRRTLIDNRNEAMAERTLVLLSDVDPAGDEARRGLIASAIQARLAAERIEQERCALQRIQAERDRIAREQREWLRAEAAAEAERERVLRALVREKAEEQKRAALAEIDRWLHEDFLAARSRLWSLPSGVVSEQEFEVRRVAYVGKWFADRRRRFGHASQVAPDPEQLAAISAVNGHVQVVARAGSGKTATLVYRALFLLEHCGAVASSLLLLAFNRKAAIEIRRRLLALRHADAEREVSAQIKETIETAGRKGRRFDLSDVEADSVNAVSVRLGVDLPHIMTFHALAYSIVHPEESLLYDGAEGDSQSLSRAFQCVIDDHLQNPEHRTEIRELMLAHFREDWERIVSGRYDQTQAELLNFRRSLPRESLGGEYVKSYGEKVIADFLFEHDVAYKYERNHWWGEINYRPDFTIFLTAKSGVIIEYFGLEGDPDYDEMTAEKRNYWRAKADWILVDFSASDVAVEGDERFRERLKHRLEQAGVACERLSEDEIWLRVRDRAIDRFTTATAGFAGRCRKQSLSPAELQGRIERHVPLSPVEAKFLGLAHKLYAAYLRRLSATGEEDFDGLMQRAVIAVSEGFTKFQRKSGTGDITDLRFIFIDEFQDFADLFYRLLRSVRAASQDVELFCVGDDWQAINGFAGSDLKFFEEFEQYFGKFRRLYLSTNYRSSQSVVAIGNALMAGLGKPAVGNKKSPGLVLIADASSFRPSLIEKQRHPGDVITPMVSRIAKSSLATGSDVVMLSRRNTLPWFVNFKDQACRDGKKLASYLDLVRSLFPKGLGERIGMSTAHRYKGLEKPTVVVMDVVARSYPLIHPDWAFSRVLGDSALKITKEERRLLYVALTRASETLVIITDRHSRSPFLDELLTVVSVADIDWRNYSPVRSVTSSLMVKVGNQPHRGGEPTFGIKDQLKACGYQWQSTGWAGWTKTFPAEGFKLDGVMAELWASAADGIEVRVYDEDEAVMGQFLVDAGQWRSVIDRLAAACAAVADESDA